MTMQIESKFKNKNPFIVWKVCMRKFDIFLYSLVHGIFFGSCPVDEINISLNCHYEGKKQV